MYKMIIVEDEDIEREGFTSQIDWESMGIEVVNAFEGSEDALQFVRDNQADILLTDIHLLGMDGLELAKRIKEFQPGIKVIITSAYQEFEYARTAIDLNAYGYISKPVNLQNLHDIVQRVLGICKSEDAEKQENDRLRHIVGLSLPLLQDRFMNNWISGNLKCTEITENLDYFKIKMPHPYFLGILSDIDNLEEVKSGKSSEDFHILSFKVLEALKEFTAAGDELNMLTFQINTGSYYTVINHAIEDRTDVHERFLQLAAEMQKAVNQQCNVNLTVCIGKTVNSPENLNISLKTAFEALKFRFFTGSNQILSYTDVYRDISSDAIPDTESIISKIVSCVEIGDSQGFKDNLSNLFAHFEEGKTDAYIIRNHCLNLVSRVSLMLAEKNERFENVFGKDIRLWEKLLLYDTMFDIHMWLKNVLSAVLDYLLQKKEGSNRKIIGDIIRIIEQKYQTNLSIMDISKEIYLSPNYISIIFKKETGENFIDYLKRFRLEKAKQLLNDPQYKIYHVGKLVGYSSISHFCSIFKDFYGVSPSEYRERS